MTCFRCSAPCSDSVVNMGIITMDTKNLEEEMNKNTEFGEKLRRISRKVEAL